MRSSFLGLEVSKRSIQLSQKALDITGNNLSNAKTEGYTRQRVDVSSLYLRTNSNWQTKTSKLSLAGQGSQAYGVGQVRDSYIDKRYREMTCHVAMYDTRASIMSEIETCLDNITNTGLTNAMDVMMDVMSTYASQPDSDEYAAIVRNQAYNVTQLLHSYNTDLENLCETNLTALETTIENTNSIITDIVEYNKAIVKEYSIMGVSKYADGESVTGGYGPNELLDARNLLIDELSYLGDITVTDNADGSVKVTMGGHTVVDGEKYNTIYMKDYEDYNAAVLKFSDGVDVELTSGEIKGYTDMLGGNGPYMNSYQNSEYGIPYYKSNLDAFANAFAGFFNDMNMKTKDADGETVEFPERVLFTTSDGAEDFTAGNIRISDEWMEDGLMFGQVYSEKKGAWETSLDGNHINEMIANFKDGIMKFGRASDFEGTIYDYLIFTNDRLGQQIEFQEEQHEVMYTTANSLLDSRDSVSGVSDTEEGINMMTYQNWYNASARMMTTLDECLDKIINGMGTVGL